MAMEDDGAPFESDTGPRSGEESFKDSIKPEEREILQRLEQVLSRRARAWQSCAIPQEVIEQLASYQQFQPNPPEEFNDSAFAPVIKTCLQQLRMFGSDREIALAAALRVHVTHTIQSAIDQQVLLCAVAAAVLDRGSIADACQMLPGSVLPAQRMGLPFESHAWPSVPGAIEWIGSDRGAAASDSSDRGAAASDSSDRGAAASDSSDRGAAAQDDSDHRRQHPASGAGASMSVEDGSDEGGYTGSTSEDYLPAAAAGTRPPVEAVVSLFDRYMEASSVSFCPLVPVRIHSAQGHARLEKQSQLDLREKEAKLGASDTQTAPVSSQHPSSRIRVAQYIRPEVSEVDISEVSSSMSDSSGMGASSIQRTRGSSDQSMAVRVSAATTQGIVMGIPAAGSARAASATDRGAAASSGHTDQPRGTAAGVDLRIGHGSGIAAAGAASATDLGTAAASGHMDQPGGTAAVVDPRMGRSSSLAAAADAVSAGSVDHVPRTDSPSNVVGISGAEQWMVAEARQFPAETRVDPTATSLDGEMLDPFVMKRDALFDMDAFAGVLRLAHPGISPHWDDVGSLSNRDHPLLRSYDYFLPDHFGKALGLDKPGREVQREWVVDGLMGVHNSSQVQPRYDNLPCMPGSYLSLLASSKQRSPVAGSIRASWSTCISPGLQCDEDTAIVLEHVLPNEDHLSPEEYQSVKERLSVQVMRLVRDGGIGCCLSVFAAGDHKSVVKYAVSMSRAVAECYEQNCKDAQDSGWSDYVPIGLGAAVVAFERTSELVVNEHRSVDEAVEIGRRLLPKMKAIHKLDEGRHIQLFLIGSTTVSALLPPGIEDTCEPLLDQLSQYGPSSSDSVRMRDRKFVNVRDSRGFWMAGTHHDRLRSCLLFVVQQGIARAKQILGWDGPDLIQHVVARTKPTAVSEYVITLAPPNHVGDSIFRPLAFSVTQSPSTFMSVALRIMQTFGQPGVSAPFTVSAMVEVQDNVQIAQLLLVRQVARCAVVYFRRVGCKAVAIMDLLSSLVRRQLDETRRRLSEQRAQAQSEAEAAQEAMEREILLQARGGDFRDTADGQTLGVGMGGDRQDSIDSFDTDSIAGTAAGGGGALGGAIEPETPCELGPPGPQIGGMRDLGACCLVCDQSHRGQPRRFVQKTDGPSACYITMAIGTNVCGCDHEDHKYIAVPVPRSIQLVHSKRKNLLSSMLYNTILQAGKYSIQSERSSPYGGIQCIGESMTSLSGALPKVVLYEDVVSMLDALKQWDDAGNGNDQIQSFVPVSCLLGAEFHVYSPGFRTGQPTPGQHDSAFDVIQKDIIAPYGHRSSSAPGQVTDDDAWAERTDSVKQDLGDALDSSMQQHLYRYYAMFSGHTTVRIEVDVPIVTLPLFLSLAVVRTEDSIRSAKPDDNGFYRAAFARGAVQLVGALLFEEADRIRYNECERVLQRTAQLFLDAICAREIHPKMRAAMFSLAVSILRTHHEGNLAVRTDSWSQVAAHQILATGIAATHPLRQLPVLDRIDVRELQQAIGGPQALQQDDIGTTARILVEVLCGVVPESKNSPPKVFGDIGGLAQIDSSPITSWGLLAVCELIIASINLCSIAECSGGTWRLGLDSATGLPTITAFSSDIDGSAKKVAGFPGGLRGIRTALRADAVASLVTGMSDQGKAGVRLDCRTHINAAAELEEYLYHAYMIQLYATKPHYSSGQKRGMLVRSSMAVCLYGELVSRGMLPRYIVLQGIAAVLRSVQIIVLPYISSMMRGTHNAGQFQMQGAGTVKPVPGPCRLVFVTRKYGNYDGVRASLPATLLPGQLMLEQLRADPMVRTNLGEGSMQDLNFMSLCRQWALQAVVVGSARPDWSRAEPGTRGPASKAPRGTSKAAAHSDSIVIPTQDFDAQPPHEVAATVATQAADILMQSLFLRRTGHWESRIRRWVQPWLGSLFNSHHDRYPQRCETYYVATPGCGVNMVLPAVTDAAPALLTDGEKYLKEWSLSEAYNSLRREMQGVTAVRKQMGDMTEAMVGEDVDEKHVIRCVRAIEVSSEAMAASVRSRWAKCFNPPIAGFVLRALETDPDWTMDVNRDRPLVQSGDALDVQAPGAVPNDSALGLGISLGGPPPAIAGAKRLRDAADMHQSATQYGVQPPQKDRRVAAPTAADRQSAAYEKYIPVETWKVGKFFDTIGMQKPTSRYRVACRAYCLAILARCSGEVQIAVAPKGQFGVKQLKALQKAVQIFRDDVTAEDLNLDLAFPEVQKADDSEASVLKWKKLCKAAWIKLIDMCPGALPRKSLELESGYPPLDEEMWEYYPDKTLWTAEVGASYENGLVGGGTAASGGGGSEQTGSHGIGASTGIAQEQQAAVTGTTLGSAKATESKTIGSPWGLSAEEHAVGLDRSILVFDYGRTPRAYKLSDSAVGRARARDRASSSPECATSSGSSTTRLGTGGIDSIKSGCPPAWIVTTEAVPKQWRIDQAWCMMADLSGSQITELRESMIPNQKYSGIVSGGARATSPIEF